MSQTRPKTPLTLAGSDPSGGAGMQADLKTFLRFGVSGAGIPTCLTIQSPTGVRDVIPIPAKQIRAQIQALLEDVKPAAIKVGLLPDAETVRTVARVLAPLTRRRVPIVLDPVLASSSGRRFLPEDDLDVYMRQLAPLATIMTPNVDEAAEMAGVAPSVVRRDAEGIAAKLVQRGPRAVLITGGHIPGDEVIDVLGTKDETVLFSADRVARRRQVHGTGCMLSAGITAQLAQGHSVEEAVGTAKAFVTRAIEGARAIGRGARYLDFTVDA